MSEVSEALMQEFRQAVYERLNSPQATEASPREAIERRAKAVSYTHLTLPTILLV